MNAKHPATNMTGTVASPSSPSVRLTAFEDPTIMNTENGIKNQPKFMIKFFKNGKYKIISFYAKKARGMMSRYIIQNRITEIEQINQFDSDGYRYNAALSEADAPVFLRG